MAASTFGTIFKITTWGESHGPALGAVIDGCPAGLLLSAADIQPYLNRRRPGHSDVVSPRKEADQVKILSGVCDGKTSGTPISLMIENNAHLSSDYDELAHVFRPGHADYTYTAKYGLRDHRGGGRASGRETAARVAAGAVALKALTELGVSIFAYSRAIGPVVLPGLPPNFGSAPDTPSGMPDADADKKAQHCLRECMERGDSVGGIVECLIRGVPAGVGEPVFDKLDALLSHALMSIGAVKAVEIGAGVATATTRASENNDAFYAEDGKVKKQSNHAGGILGGISDGGDIILRAHFKPTPSVSLSQKTVDQLGQPVEISIKGRHDPCIVPRAVVVVEAMAAITILDAMMMNMAARMDNLKHFYGDKR